MLPAATIRTLTTPSSPPPSSPLTQWDSAEDKAKFANELMKFLGIGLHFK